MSDIYLSIAETPTVVTLTNPLVSSAIAQSVTVTNVVSVSVVTMPAISVSGGLTNAELRASAVTVALDANSLSALEQVTVTIGAAVSISNFPSTQTIAGTVTVGASSVTFNAYVGQRGDGSWQPISLQTGSNYVNANVQNSVTIGSLPAISGTVTARTDLDAYGNSCVVIAFDSPAGVQRVGNVNGFPIRPMQDQFGANIPLPISGTVTVGNSVTIGSLPAISGTVTVGNNNFNIKAITVGDGSNFFYITNAANYRLFSPTGASKTLNNIFGATPSWIVAFSDSVTWVSDSGTEVSYFHDGTQWTLDDFTTPAGTLALNGSVFITNVSGVSGINILNGFTATQLGSPLVDSGATRVQIYSSTVTAAAPNGSLTTRFGTPTTANVSFATAAVTKSDRKYLLIQNVTTGSNVITVGIGFTPTTTQGIQLTAGAGITFESSYIPTGAVYVLSSVTASNFTILEA